MQLGCIDVNPTWGAKLYFYLFTHLTFSPAMPMTIPGARAKITSHFKARCILPGGVAKAQNMLDIPALSRLARQAPQCFKSVN